jgi:hypothetical protein
MAFLRQKGGAYGDTFAQNGLAFFFVLGAILLILAGTGVI